jgi:hypothetical protein
MTIIKVCKRSILVKNSTGDDPSHKKPPSFKYGRAATARIARMAKDAPQIPGVSEL